MQTPQNNLHAQDQDGREGRRGDAIEIAGDYQYRARTAGFVVQRYWHFEKERVVRKFCAPKPGDLALDVGCGSGVIANLLAELGAKTVGIDSNPSAIEFARRRFGRSGLEFHLGQVDDLAFREESVDCVYCMEVIEHLYEAQVPRLLARLNSVVRKGGRILVTTPNYHGAWPLLEATLDAFRLVPRLKGDQHVTKFHKKKLRFALEGAGWELEHLATFSTAAPFVSVVGWRLAQAVSAIEDRVALPFGNVLLAVARRP